MKKILLATERRRDLLVITALVLLAIPTTIFLNANFLTSTLLFFGVPSAYLIVRRPQNLKKATVAGLILGLGLGFSFDFIAEFNNAWGWGADFALPTELFGVVSLDVLIWFFLWVFLVVAYYEHFIEHDRSQKISPKAKWIFVGALLIAAVVVILWKLTPEILLFNYAYATLGTIAFLICGVLLVKNPHLTHKVLRAVPFFTFMYLSYEITALYMNLWTFPGAYLGSVSVHTLTFPLEELVVWIIASSAIVATYYEFCIDDNK